MERPWYEEAGSEEDRLYEDSVNRIKSSVRQGIYFDEACALIDIKEPGLRQAVFKDSLKVIIAEMHFLEGMPLNKVAKALKLPIGRLEHVKKEMLKDVEKTAIDAFKKSGEALI